MITPPTKRFEFGENWTAYLQNISDEHIQRALSSFTQFHGVTRLDGKSFLDIGCGSGIHSYVVYLLGAGRLVSFDYDANSVSACRELQRQKAPQAAAWEIFQADILALPDRQRLGTFDIVYAWGVLHHTGAMWKAIESACGLVQPGGVLHLAIYNRHWTSPLWKAIKWTYCHVPRWGQKALLGCYASAEFVRIFLFKRRNPFTFIKEYPQQRGMRWLTDLKDWLGGYPYEYASAAEIQSGVERLGFQLEKSALTSSIGCSEFLFRRKN